ncbi:MAG: GntR family transcriptional regulator [Chloroflexi bacterium]|nr:GntR family transcriptional regulator [Chloroflexota bacterium]
MNRGSVSLHLSQDHLPLADLVFNSLRDAIIQGSLQPGTWLRQAPLAEELGVSQMPVREALKRLVAEGLAERIPYKGVKVVEFTPEDIVDISTNRLVLESLAVRLAAPLITDEELAELRKILEESEKCVTEEEVSRRRVLNNEFHLLICKASRRRYLVHLIEALWKWFPSVMLYEGMLRQKDLLPIRSERENQEHWAILHALEQRNAQLAEREVRRHIQNLSQELTEILGIPEEVVKPLGELYPHYSLLEQTVKP